MYVSIIGRGFFKHVKHKGMKTSTLSGRWEPHVTIAASASIRPSGWWMNQRHGWWMVTRDLNLCQ